MGWLANKYSRNNNAAKRDDSRITEQFDEFRKKRENPNLEERNKQAIIDNQVALQRQQLLHNQQNQDMLNQKITFDLYDKIASDAGKRRDVLKAVDVQNGYKTPLEKTNERQKLFQDNFWKLYASEKGFSLDGKRIDNSSKSSDPMTEILNMQNTGQGQAGQAPTTQRNLQDIINDANTITGSMIPGVPGALSDAINNRQRIPGEAYLNGQLWTGGLAQVNQNTAQQNTTTIQPQTTQPTTGQRRTYTDIPPSVTPRGQSTGQSMNNPLGGSPVQRLFTQQSQVSTVQPMNNNPLGGSPTQRLFNQDQTTAPDNKKKKKIQ